MTFGGQTSERDAAVMLDLFLAEGHTWVDTAFMYTEGRSETILGRLLKGARRERVFLATKAYPDRLGPGKPRGLTPGSVRGQLETSLRRMKQECVDVFYLHAPDNETPLEVTLETCAALRAEGKLREIGMSNYASWQVAEAVAICLKNDWPAPIIYQGMYNAVTRDVERECIPACRHFGVDFIAYNPLAGGLLTGKYADPAAQPESGRFSGEYYRDRFWKQEYFAALQVLEEVAGGRDAAPHQRFDKELSDNGSRDARAQHAAPLQRKDAGLRNSGSRRAGGRDAAPSRATRLSEAALRWLLHHSQSDGLVLGASTVEHLKANLAACRKGPLGMRLVAAFDEAWEIARPACQQYFRNGATTLPPRVVGAKKN